VRLVGPEMQARRRKQAGAVTAGAAHSRAPTRFNVRILRRTPSSIRYPGAKPVLRRAARVGGLPLAILCDMLGRVRSGWRSDSKPPLVGLVPSRNSSIVD
jgi:hypothetical protein